MNNIMPVLPELILLSTGGLSVVSLLLMGFERATRREGRSKRQKPALRLVSSKEIKAAA